MATPNTLQAALIGDLQALDVSLASSLAAAQATSVSAHAKGAPVAAGAVDEIIVSLQAAKASLDALVGSDIEIANLG